MVTVLPEGEVKPGEVIPPEELFRENLDAIVSAMNSRRVGECDLTLNETTYLVTIRSATGSSTLTFSANTGKVRVTGTQTPPPASPAAPPGRLALPPLLPSQAAALAIVGRAKRSSKIFCKFALLPFMT